MHTQKFKFGVSSTLTMSFSFNAEPQDEHRRFKRQRGGGYGGGFGLNFKAPVDDMFGAKKLKSQNRLNGDDALEALFRRRLRYERQGGERPVVVD